MPQHQTMDSPSSPVQATDENGRQVAETFLRGLRTRDWALLRSIMTEDIVWTLPGRSRISGEARGIDAVLDRAQTIVGYGVTFNLNHLLVGQYGSALSLHNTAQRDGRILDEQLATVCRIRDGHIHAIDTYLSEVDMVNSFFA